MSGRDDGKEPLRWRFTGEAGFIRYVSDRQYESFHPDIQRWYEPLTAPVDVVPWSEEQEVEVLRMIDRLQLAHESLKASGKTDNRDFALRLWYNHAIRSMTELRDGIVSRRLMEDK